MRCSALETNHRFDGSAASQLAFDLGREPPLLARHIDPKLVMGRRIVATVAGIGEQALDGVADHVFHGGNNGCQCVAVIGIARQSGDMGHKLAARRLTSGPMRLALANALTTTVAPRCQIHFRDGHTSSG